MRTSSELQSLRKQVVETGWLRRAEQPLLRLGRQGWAALCLLSILFSLTHPSHPTTVTSWYNQNRSHDHYAPSLCKNFICALSYLCPLAPSCVFSVALTCIIWVLCSVLHVTPGWLVYRDNCTKVDFWVMVWYGVVLGALSTDWPILWQFHTYIMHFDRTPTILIIIHFTRPWNPFFPWGPFLPSCFLLPFSSWPSTRARVWSYLLE